MKKYINFIIALFLFPILNLVSLKILGYINWKVRVTFDIKYMLILALLKIIMILFLGFMVAYYFNFASDLSKKTAGILFLIEIFILAIYMVTKKYYLPEKFFYIYDFNVLYFFLLLGENIFLLLDKKS